MVLRAGEGVVGALVDAQLSSILGAVVDEDFLVAENVLDSPTTNLNNNSIFLRYHK